MSELSILVSGVLERRKDGSNLMGRVVKEKQIWYVLWPNREKPKGRRAESCNEFGAASKRASAELKDPVMQEMWEARFQKYLADLKVGEEQKYHTLKGFANAWIRREMSGK